MEECVHKRATFLDKDETKVMCKSCNKVMTLDDMLQEFESAILGEQLQALCYQPNGEVK